jgi:hypothetical protein
MPNSSRMPAQTWAQGSIAKHATLLSLLSLLSWTVAGCGTTDTPAIGPGQSDVGGGGGGGDGGIIDGAVSDTSGGEDATTQTDAGGGGMCGDGTCDPLESASTCPTDCKESDAGGGGVTPIVCLQKNCVGELQACSLDGQCAVTLGCVAGCQDGGCLGICRTKAAAAGGLSDATNTLFLCAAQAKCAGGGTTQPVCGNGKCEPGESAKTCATDCGGIGPVCGNGVCEPNENNCPKDCGGGPVCGNGQCEFGEDDFTCPADCNGKTTICGDGFCQGDEPKTCPEDCAVQPSCGDGKCQGDESKTCPKDCGPQAVCGNNQCDPGESALSCPADCAKPVCGDGICAASESSGTCAKDCGTDPISCAQVKCADEFKLCTNDPPCAKLLTCFLGCNGNEQCAQQCFASAGGQLPKSFEPLAKCGNEFCDNGVCGDGECKGDENTKTCPKDCKPESSCGDGICSGNESPLTCGADCGPPQPVCGNGACEPGENAFNCSKDCGNPSSCGNGKCDNTETSQSCPADCQAPGDLLSCAKKNCEKQYISCSGNAACAKALSCIGNCKVLDNQCLNGCASQNPASLQYLAPLGSCASNAGCLSGGGGSCGDGQCSSTESSQNCPEDCGPPKPVCGNGVCEPGEQPGPDGGGCAKDCGTGSCKGNCGGQAGTCWCDGQCAQMGDCCKDIKTYCPDVVPICGDGKCQDGEDQNSCPKDCGEPSQGCKSKSDCKDAEICCNGSKGQICTLPAQCF